MSASVVRFPGVTKLNTDPQQVLSFAMDDKVSSAVVIGWDADGDFYFASSLADGAEVLWLLKLAEKRLLEIGDGGE